MKIEDQLETTPAETETGRPPNTARLLTVGLRPPTAHCHVRRTDVGRWR